MIATPVRGRFCRIAYSYVKNREDALDIVHSAIVKALRSYTGLRRPEYARAGLRRTRRLYANSSRFIKASS